MVGSRLKLARNAAGLSLRELSTQIGGRVSAQALGKYERDEMTPGEDVLGAMADALGVTVGYLQNVGHGSLSSVEFRKRAVTSAKAETNLKARILNRVERYLQIEDILVANTTNWSPPAGFPFDVRTIEGAELAAERLRERWDLGLGPIASLPDLLEEQGIKVLVVSLPESFSGLMAKIRRTRGGYVYAIVINEDQHGERQRFTLAHELGHLVLHIQPDVDQEKACHRFASALLLPSFVLKTEVGQYRRQLSLAELLRLKTLFGVSVQAIVYRLKDLHIIGEPYYRRLFQNMSRMGWRGKTGEPQGRPAEKSERFQRLCLRAFSEKLISEERAAELMDMTVAKFRQLAEKSNKPATLDLASEG